jgi:hypothetical protein
MQLTNTIEFLGHDLRVTYNYEEGEKGVWRDDDGGGVAPTPPEAEIIKVMLGNYDLTELLEPRFIELEMIIIDEHEI